MSDDTENALLAKIAEMEKKLDEQAKAFAHLNLFIEAVTPLITRQKSRAERAKELGISLPTLARREQRARINLELDKL